MKIKKSILRDRIKLLKKRIRISEKIIKEKNKLTSEGDNWDDQDVYSIYENGQNITNSNDEIAFLEKILNHPSHL